MVETFAYLLFYPYPLSVMWERLRQLRLRANASRSSAGKMHCGTLSALAMMNHECTRGRKTGRVRMINGLGGVPYTC